MMNSVTIGALMIVGGVIGAVVIPAFSDKQQKRQKYLVIAFAGAIPGLIGLTFASSTFMLFSSAFVIGFFLVSAMPISMQYAAEVTHPTPEGTSNSLIQLFGQSAVVFVESMVSVFLLPAPLALQSALTCFCRRSGIADFFHRMYMFFFVCLP